MKKLLKSVSAILISIVYFLCSGNVVHGETSNILNDYFKNGEWKYLLTSNNYQYKQLSNAIRSSAADQYMLSIIDFYISTGAEPDKRKYEEVLMNIIMTYEYDSSEKISEQYKMDKMKSGKEYLMDAKDAVNSALKIYSGMHGNGDEWEEALVTAIDSLSTFTDNADNWLSALCDLETILYNYGKLDELLNYIYENSSGELKKAAQELNSGMKSLMCIKLEMYNDVSNKNFQNYTELLFTDSFIKAVKLSDEYANDENLKFFVDKADGLFEVLDVMKNSWNLGVIIGKTIGNITVGGENIIRRVHEIEALSDIEDVLSNKILEEQNVLLGNQTIENLQNYVYDCNILTGTHIRGEYCVYSIIVKDAGWLSLLNFSKAEDAKQWYDLKTERILKISSNLENLLNDFKNDLKNNITLDNIDNIFSPTYSEQRYLDFNNLFLGCLYNEPSEIDLNIILYDGLGEKNSIKEITDKEITELNFDKSIIINHGIYKIDKEKLNKYLKLKTGLFLSEFKNNKLNYKYLDKYKSYYRYGHGDTNAVNDFNFQKLQLLDDGIYVGIYTRSSEKNAKFEVKFKMNNGVLQFISNKKLENNSEDTVQDIKLVGSQTWQSEYKKIISSINSYYTLFDIDTDGIPELIFEDSTDGEEVSRKICIYTYKKNQLEKQYIPCAYTLGFVFNNYTKKPGLYGCREGETYFINYIIFESNKFHLDHASEDDDFNGFNEKYNTFSDIKMISSDDDCLINDYNKILEIDKEGQIDCNNTIVPGYDSSYICQNGNISYVRYELGDEWHITAKSKYVNYGVTWYELWDSDDGDYYGWVSEKFIDFYE